MDKEIYGNIKEYMEFYEEEFVKLRQRIADLEMVVSKLVNENNMLNNNIQGAQKNEEAALPSDLIK